MALPITIASGTQRLEDPCGGPFKSGTSFYLVRYEGSGALVQVLKADSDDPSSGWTRQDTSNEPNFILGTYHSYLDGTTIHIPVQSTANGDIEYNTFNCSTNTFGVIDESVTTDPPTTAAHVSVSVRSDGDVILVYAGVPEANMGTDYDRIDLARRETGSWTTGVSVDNLGKTETHMRWPFVVRGDATNDRMHIFYKDITGDGLHYSTYLSGNTWGHQHTEADSAIAAADSTAVSPRSVSFDDGGTTKVRIVYQDAATEAAVVGFNDADDPGASISIATDITGAAPCIAGGRAFAVDDATDTQYFLCTDTATASRDIDEHETGSGDDIWTANTGELVGASGSYELFSSMVYDNGGTVLAYLYKDGTTYRYNERSLAAPAGLTFLPPHRRQPNLRF